MAILPALTPEQIGWTFGRTQTRFGPVLPTIRARTKFLLLAAGAVTLILLFAAIENVLVPRHGQVSDVTSFLHPGAKPKTVALPLLYDPPGLILIGVALATPVFCARQVEAITDFVAMNEQNITYRLATLNVATVGARIDSANASFKAIGSRRASVAILFFSFSLSVTAYAVIAHAGLLASWNPSKLPRSEWSGRVYRGWWANFSVHPALAVLLILVCTYMFYFLVKQVCMGVVFSYYAQASRGADFGVAPNLETNIDGYWGLRKLRYFMQWTYGSTLSHFIAALGVITVWLPFSRWTVPIVVLIMLTNCLVVIFPTLVAAETSIAEKQKFVKYLGPPSVLPAERATRDGTVERIWSLPNIPFRLRSTLSASAIYLLAPLILAIVSKVLSR